MLPLVDMRDFLVKPLSKEELDLIQEEIDDIRKVSSSKVDEYDDYYVLNKEQLLNHYVLILERNYEAISKRKRKKLRIVGLVDDNND